jgi:hypothetical protein
MERMRWLSGPALKVGTDRKTIPKKTAGDLLPKSPKQKKLEFEVDVQR